MTKRIVFCVHGQVQGVGFRHFTRKRAISYDLTGWVRNTKNQEKVEGEVQGDEAELQNFFKDIDKGPTHAHVVKVEKSQVEVVDEEADFEIRR